MVGADDVQLASYDAYYTGTKNYHRIMTMLFSLDDYAQVHISPLLDTGHADNNLVHYRYVDYYRNALDFAEELAAAADPVSAAATQ